MLGEERQILTDAGFEVLTLLTVNITALWDVKPCNPVEKCKYFRVIFNFRFEE
jgi:hypothetical protein